MVVGVDGGGRTNDEGRGGASRRRYIYARAVHDARRRGGRPATRPGARARVVHAAYK